MSEGHVEVTRLTSVQLLDAAIWREIGTEEPQTAAAFFRGPFFAAWPVAIGPVQRARDGCCDRVVQGQKLCRASAAEDGSAAVSQKTTKAACWLASNNTKETTQMTRMNLKEKFPIFASGRTG